jgi:hypothetical protein
MVAANQDESATAGEVDKLLDTVLRIRSPVNHVAEDDDRVFRLRIDGLDEGPQCGGTPVYVSDCEQASRNPVGVIARLPNIILESVRTVVHFNLLPRGEPGIPVQPIAAEYLPKTATGKKLPKVQDDLK